MTIRARVKPSWPVIVEGVGGIIVTQSRGRAVIDFDYTSSELGAELQQAVDAAAVSAVDAATSETAAEAAQAAAETAAESATSASNVTTFATKALAIAASPVTQYVRYLGIAAQGDFGGVDALYSLAESAPSHDHYITCANGSIYIRVPPPAGVPCNVVEIGLLPNRGSGTDCTPDLNAVFTAADNSDCKFWMFPSVGSQYYFNSKPNPMPPMRVKGPGMLDTINLYKNFVSDNPWDGIFNIHASNTFVEDLRFVGLGGSQNATASNVGTGCAISIVSNATDGEMGYGGLNNIEVTSDASLPNGHACLAYNIYVDGAVGGSLPGVRAFPMTNLKMFGAELGALFLKCAVAAKVDGPGCFTAGGLTSKVWIDGISGKSAGGFAMNLANMLDGIDVDWTTGLNLQVGIIAGDIDVSATCVNTYINGSLSLVTSITNLSASTKFSDLPYLSGTASLSTTAAAQNYGTGRQFLLTPQITLQPLDASDTGATGIVTARSAGGWTGKVSSGSLTVDWVATGIINTWAP